MVKFTEFTEEDAKKPYDEFFANIPLTEQFEVKDLSFEDKQRFIKYIMGDKRLVNSNLLMNIALLVRGTDLSDEIFDNTEIIFKSLEEYVDLKYELKDIIGEYTHDMIKYLFSAIRSYALILPDGKEPIPEAYTILLCTSSIKDISKLLNKTSVDSDEWVLVSGSEDIINSLFGLSPAIELFMNNLKEHMEKEE